jgi:hypothetical protein
MKTLHTWKRNLSTDTVCQLAEERGCILRMLFGEGMPLYWVENQYFIGQPFKSLDDLAGFLRRLPMVSSH